MKPQIGTLKESEGQIVNEVKETRTRNWALLVIGACVFLALMTAAILVSVYLGYSLHTRGSTENQKTYTADFYQDGRHVVKETLVVTERESMYAAPNGTMVKDYETGFAVYKMDHLPGCYLTTFNMSERDNYSSNGHQQVSIEVTQTSKQRYSVTDITVNRAVLGPQAATMCAGRDLYMLRQKPGFGDALRCMSCHSTPTIQQCRETTACKEHEICSVEEFISATGEIYYKLGCQSKGTCQNLGMRRRSVTNKTGEEDIGNIAICAECCSSPYCNMEGCGQPALPTNERGPYCFTCDKASSPDGCDNVTVCEKGDSCMLNIDASNLGQSGNFSYTSLCQIDLVCSALEHAHISSMCPATCCKGDFCNTKCGDILTTATTLLPSIHQTTHSFASLTTHKPYCPPDHSFDSLSLLCIKLEEATKVSFSEAQAFCRQTGDELVTLDTYAKFNFVQYAIIHQSKEEQQQRNYWIGAHANQTSSGKVFGWERLRPWGFTAWGPDEPDVDPSQLCVVLNVLEKYEWFDTRCDSSFHFICEHDILVNGGFTTGMAHPTASSKPLTTPSTPSTISPSTHSSLISSSTTVLSMIVSQLRS